MSDQTLWQPRAIAREGREGASSRSQVVVIVLAGGLGTRLREAVPATPKPLAPIGPVPFLSILLQQLRRWPVKSVLICAGRSQQPFEAVIRSTRGLDVSLVREPQLRGTAGAVALAAELVDVPRYLVMNGDTFFDLDVSDLLELHSRRSACITLAVTPSVASSRFGTVQLGTGGRVLRFREKPPDSGRQLVSTGIAVLERSVVSAIPRDRPVSLEHEVLPGIARGCLFALVSTGAFIDIGTPESYEFAVNHRRELFGSLADAQC